MKRLLFVILNVIVFHVYAWEQRQPLPLAHCKIHAPYGFADSAVIAKPICREAYLVAFDVQAKIPVYVSYTLQPHNALGCWPRTNAFVADKSIPNSPTPNDYSNTGYDKGHAVPDGDLSWSEIVEYESFLMTNMYPQHGSLNRGIWKLLETSVRGWAVQTNNSYTIYVGAFYNNTDIIIGNGVVVPHAFYKIVINNNTGATAGWVFPHTQPYKNLGTDLTKFRVPIAQIQQLANVEFTFPKQINELNPGQEWPVDYGALTDAKRNKCKR